MDFYLGTCRNSRVSTLFCGTFTLTLDEMKRRSRRGRSKSDRGRLQLRQASSKYSKGDGLVARGALTCSLYLFRSILKRPGPTPRDHNILCPSASVEFSSGETDAGAAAGDEDCGSGGTKSESGVGGGDGGIDVMGDGFGEVVEGVEVGH